MMKSFSEGIGRFAFFPMPVVNLVSIISPLTSRSKVLLPTAYLMVTWHGRRLGGGM